MRPYKTHDNLKRRITIANTIIPSSTASHQKPQKLSGLSVLGGTLCQNKTTSQPPQPPLESAQPLTQTLKILRPVSVLSVTQW